MTPSLETPTLSCHARYHAVRFYESDRSLAAIVGKFLSDGLNDGHPAIVIAIAAHRAAIVRDLVTRRHDVVELQRTGALLLVDAQNTLDTFMSNGNVEDTKFKDVVSGILRAGCRDRVDRVVRVYGELVNLLWCDGQQDSAVRVEGLWNSLAASESFSLVCGYAMGQRHKKARLDEICGQHTHVISADGTLERVT